MKCVVTKACDTKYTSEVLRKLKLYKDVLSMRATWTTVQLFLSSLHMSHLHTNLARTQCLKVRT